MPKPKIANPTPFTKTKALSLVLIPTTNQPNTPTN